MKLCHHSDAFVFKKKFDFYRSENLEWAYLKIGSKICSIWSIKIRYPALDMAENADDRLVLDRRFSIAILQIVDQLSQALAQSAPIPFSPYRLIHAEEFSQLVERMRINVPSSIRESERTLAERDLIMADARAEADQIIEQAKQQAIEMLSQERVVANAEKEAERILNNGRGTAQRRVDEADRYAASVLQDLSQKLGNISQQVDNGIQVLQQTSSQSIAGQQLDEHGDEVQ